MNKKILSPKKDKKEFFLLMFLFIFAFVLRLIYLFEIKENPHFFTLTMDPLYHDVWAKSIANGDILGSRIFFRAPFYPYFLALVYKIFGHNYFIPRLIQHLIGATSCVLVYFLAKKLFNKTVAIISFLFAACYGMLIYFESELLLDSFLVFFNILLILFLLKTKEDPQLGRWLVCGLILGLSAITRPNILFFVPFIWLWIYLSFRNQINLRRITLFSAVFLLGAIILIFPITLRNALIGKDLVLISSQGGANFYIGNNENSDGMSAIFYKSDWEYRDFQYVAQKEMGRALKPSEISRFYYKKGIDFILKKPKASIKLLLKKLYLFWNKFEISNNQNIYFFRRYSLLIRILPFGFWFIGPLSLTGIALSLKEKRKIRRMPDIFLPLFFVLSYMVTVVLFFVTARFRLPVIPFLIIFSSFAIYWIGSKLIKGKRGSLKIFLLFLIPSLILVNSNLYGLEVGDFSQAHFSLGNVYLKRGDLEKALKEYDLAIQIAPLSRARLNRGIIFFKKGDLNLAKKEFLEELKIDPDNQKVYNNLSVIYRLEGDYIKSERMALKALDKKPYYQDAFINLALAYQKQKDSAKAKNALLRGINQIGDFIEADFLLATLYQKEENIDSAIYQYKKVISKKSKEVIIYDLETLFAKDFPSRKGKEEIIAYSNFNLGVIFVQKGKWEKAELHFKEAIKGKPDFAEAHLNLGLFYDGLKNYSFAIFHITKALEIAPFNPVYHYNLGLVYAKADQLYKATEEFKKSLELDPTFEKATEKLKLVDSLLHNRSIKK